nr:MAG TPA_asm: hypothetical protein [Caudoviricetes sp.]
MYNSPSASGYQPERTDLPVLAYLLYCVWLKAKCRAERQQASCRDA